MKKLSVQTSIALVLLLSGCSLHSGYMTNSASLSSSNFSYVKTNLKGYSKAVYVFGIGGLDHDALVDEAKRNLLDTTPLKDNQALVNITLSWKSSFVIPLVITRRCTITADIVEFK